MSATASTRKRINGTKNVNVDDAIDASFLKYGKFNLQNLVFALKDTTLRGICNSLLFIDDRVPADNVTAIATVKKRTTKPKSVTTVAVTKSRSSHKPTSVTQQTHATGRAVAPPPPSTTVKLFSRDTGGDIDDDDGDDDQEHDDASNGRGGEASGLAAYTDTARRNKKQRFHGSTAITTSAEIRACEGCQQRNAKSGCLLAVIRAGGLSAFVQMGWIRHDDLLTFDMSSGLKYFGRVIQNDHATYIRDVHSNNLYSSPHDWMLSLYLVNNQQLPHQDIKNSCQLDLSTQCYRFVTVCNLDLNLHQLAIAFVHCHCLWCKQNNVSFTPQRPIVDKEIGMPRITMSLIELRQLFELNYTSVVSKNDRNVNSALANEVTCLRKKVHELQFNLFMSAFEQQGNSTALVMGTNGNPVSSHQILENAMENALFKVHNIGNNDGGNNRLNNNNNYYTNASNNNNDSSARPSPVMNTRNDGSDDMNGRLLEDNNNMRAPYLEPIGNITFEDELFGFSANFLNTANDGRI
jgi:hypothetical protein